MKLIYMEITHNTDDSARDLSSLDEGEELKKKKKSGIVIFFPPSPWQVPAVGLFLQVCFWSTPSVGSGHVCLGWGTQPSVCARVCDGERVRELLSLCWPCRAPACLSGSHWSIMLSDCPEKTHYSETTQHISSELQVSLLCVVLIPHHPWMQMSCLQCPDSQIATNSGAEAEVSHLKYPLIFVWIHQLLHFVGTLKSV